MKARIEDVDALLQDVKDYHHYHAAKCPCPNHGRDGADSKSSLLYYEHNGYVYFECQAECPYEDVEAALGYSGPLPDDYEPIVERLKKRHDSKNGKTPDNAYSHRYVDGKTGEILAVKCRVGSGDNKEVWWDLPFAPGTHVPYYDEALQVTAEFAKEDSHNLEVFVLEGEKVVELFYELICHDGDSPNPLFEYSVPISIKDNLYRKSILNRLKKIVELMHPSHVNFIIIPDHDIAGNRIAESTARQIWRVSTNVRIVNLPGLENKEDLEQWIQKGGTPEQLRELVDNTALFEYKPEEALEDERIAWILQCLENNEQGDGLLFAQECEGAARYCLEERAWLVWDGYHWQTDTANYIAHMVANTLRYAYNETSSVVWDVYKTYFDAGNEVKAKQYKDLLDSLRSRKKAVSTAKRIKNLLEFAEKPLQISIIKFDNNPWIIGTPTGVIDLTTGEFRKGRVDDYIRLKTGVDWVEDTERLEREWEQIVLEIMNDRPERAECIQRMIGYFLTGSVREKIFPIMCGSGNNGKGTLLESLGDTLGDYAMPMPSEQLQPRTQKGTSPEPWLANLKGKRFTWASETSSGMNINVALIKWLTGMDKITARLLHGNPITFKATHKLALMTNSTPEIVADDNAIWNRVMLIPFDVEFTENPVEANQKLLDKELVERLPELYPAILKWAVKGCLKWQKDGLMIPEDFEIATHTYRKSQDYMMQFITEYGTPEEDAFESSTVMWFAWEQYRDNYNPNYKVARNQLPEKLHSAFKRIGKPFKYGLKTIKRHTQRGYTGFKLNDDVRHLAEMRANNEKTNDRKRPLQIIK